MLKKYSNTNQLFSFLVFSLLILNQTHNKILWKFWNLSFLNSLLGLFFFKKKYFFFKFIKFNRSLKKFNSSKKKKNKPKKIITWFIEKTTLPINYKCVKLFRYFIPRVTSKFFKKTFRRTKFSKIRRNFLKILKQRISWSSLKVGRLLFNSNKKKNLKKLFKLFRSTNNSPFFKNSFNHKFFPVFFSQRFNWISLKLSFIFRLLHTNTMSIVFFNAYDNLYKRKLLFIHRRYKMAVKPLLRKKRKKMSNRRYYKKIAAKNFKKFKKLIFRNRFPRTLIFYKDNLSQLYFFQNALLPIFNYYLFVFINIWNIRSYNWKQIT